MKKKLVFLFSAVLMFLLSDINQTYASETSYEGVFSTAEIDGFNRLVEQHNMTNVFYIDYVRDAGGVLTHNKQLVGFPSNAEPVFSEDNNILFFLKESVPYVSLLNRNGELLSGGPTYHSVGTTYGLFKPFVVNEFVNVKGNINLPEDYITGFITENIKGVSNVFNDDGSLTYQYQLPSNENFSHLEIYQDNELIKDNYKLNSLKITGLEPLMNYNFKFISVDTSGNKSKPYVSTVQMPKGPDLIPPLEISDINHVVSSTSVQFSYLLPIDDDFSHLQVWRNNVMIADNLKINSFNDNDLYYETTYNYVFKSVDFSGNVSNGSSLTVKTMPEIDEIAPLSPVGVDVISGNASLFLSWSASPENDVVGYNVYVDGVKRNGSPVAGNSFRMTNLVNGQEYSLQVSAVDTSGNESELTQTFVGVPDSAMLPIFKVDTDLSAVAKSTENWFSQLWLVTAFSASIPIAFFVGGRIKSLFFA